jgi:hypothetical protein
MLRRRNGFTLVELTVTTVMTASLAIMLGTTWRQLSRPMSDLIAWGQLFQEIDLAVAALSRDVGGSQPDYTDSNATLGGKQQGRLLGVRSSPTDANILQLWFDGGNNTSIPPPSWPDLSTLSNGDTIVEYSYSADDANNKYLLVRTRTVYGNTKTTAQYTVASLGKPPKTSSDPAMKITPQTVAVSTTNVQFLQIDLTFTYHYPQETYNPNYEPVTRTCTLVVQQFP